MTIKDFIYWGLLSCFFASLFAWYTGDAKVSGAMCGVIGFIFLDHARHNKVHKTIWLALLRRLNKA